MLAGAVLALSAPAALAAPATEHAGAARAPVTFRATIRDGRAAANELLQGRGAPSLSLALVSGESVIWREGFGYADKAAGAHPGRDTMYGLGSVSKTLTAVAVMKLVDQGRLALDEPVTTCLPTFRMQSPGYSQVTVRMLLDHSSGFPGSAYASVETGEYWPGYVDQVMDSLAHSRLKYTPGMYGVYCNDGYTLFEKIIPAVTGRSYAEFLQDEVLLPLGMKHTLPPLTPFADGSYAKAYAGDVARPREVFNPLASGGVYSTPSDMARLAAMLMNGGVFRGTRILSAAAVREMGQDATVGMFRPVASDAMRFGLGWDSVGAPDLKRVGVTAWMKGGDSQDYHAALLVAPAADLAVVLQAVAPIGSGDLEALGQRIMLHALVDRRVLRRVPSLIPAVAPAAQRATQATLQRMLGFWAGNGTVLRITAAAEDAQSLTASLLAGGEWLALAQDLRLRRDGCFHADGSASSLRTLAAGGRLYLVSRTVAGSGRSIDDAAFAQKLSAALPEVSAAWRARAGHVWLAVDEPAASSLYRSNAGPVLQVGEVPGLNGYVTVTTAPYGLQIVNPLESEGVGLMFLQLPGLGSRDMNDLVVQERGGEEWLEYGTTLYRPLDGVADLVRAVTQVTVGPEGYAEWRRLPLAATVGLESAAAGASWRLYGTDMSVLGGGTTFPASVDAPQGACLAVFGPAGSETTVTVSTGVVARTSGGAQGAAAAQIVIPVRPAPSAAPHL